MNSFTLTAVGNLARNPEAVAKGDVTYTKFCLVGNDYAGKDEEGTPREVVTTLWFVAFGTLGDTIVHNARKGDQLIVEARVRANSWTDKQGEKQYDHGFVVQGFRFGAPGKVKREEREHRREEALLRGEERGNGRDGAVSGSKVDPKPDADSEANAINNTKSGADGDADATHGANGKNGVSATVGAPDKPAPQRAGRRAPAAPP
jgi:single-strand DNA-binding protein